MDNGNGKDHSAEALMAPGFEEDEEEFDLPDNVGNSNEDEEVIPIGVASPMAAGEPSLEDRTRAPVSEPTPAGSHAGGAMRAESWQAAPLKAPESAAYSSGRHAPANEVQLSGVQERDSVHVEMPPGAEIGLPDPKPSGTQAVSSGKRTDTAGKPRRRRRWLRSVLTIAILAPAVGAGYWFWPFGNLAPVLASFLSQQPEPATANSTEAESAPTPDQPTLGILGERLDALSRDIESLGSDGTREDINAYLGDQSSRDSDPPAQDGAEGPQDPPATQPSAELAALTPELSAFPPREAGAAGKANARLEEVESLLAGLTERLIFLEGERREMTKSAQAPAGASTPVMPEPEYAATLAPTILPEIAATLPAIQPVLPAESEPARASIAECGADERAVVETLGVLQVAAHEGADGRRWARVIGSRWRRDLDSGERLPVGNPGEARMWVDEVGVFGVVELPGRPPCRVLWDGNKTQ